MNSPTHPDWQRIVKSQTPQDREEVWDTAYAALIKQGLAPEVATHKLIKVFQEFHIQLPDGLLQALNQG